MTPADLLPWLLVLALLATVWWLWRALRQQRASPGRASRARNVRAQQGEADAELLLEDLGYVVVDRQVVALWWIEVDGEEQEVEVRADLLVEDEDGAQFVAEVKTGALAPDPTHAATRRQLLEYAHVFAPLGVLLVDVEGGEVLRVRFPGTEA